LEGKQKLFGLMNIRRNVNILHEKIFFMHDDSCGNVWALSRKMVTMIMSQEMTFSQGKRNSREKKSIC